MARRGHAEGPCGRPQSARYLLGGDEDFARRFRREAALAARLSGPHIVPIHDYGEIDGRLFIDMALIDGVDLTVLVEQRGPLPPAQAVGIVAQVAKALDTARQAGLVHRDVKPPNILVTDSGGEDFAYLIDFGISRALDGTKISLSGAVTGTPAYRAPERFAGGGDHRSDIYALGCVLYESLTGLLPFEATDLLMFMNAHQNIPPPRASAMRLDLPPELDDVIARALAKAPEERHPYAHELAIRASCHLWAVDSTGPRCRRRFCRSSARDPGSRRSTNAIRATDLPDATCRRGRIRSDFPTRRTSQTQRHAAPHDARRHAPAPHRTRPTPALAK